MNNKEIGNLGEEIARNYLKENKYKIIESNFTRRGGEIDIIAKDKRELVFIEVKTRKNIKYGTPIEAVNKIKQKHIYKTAEYYIYKNNIKNTPIRFDVVEVYMNIDNIKINHIKQVIENNPMM